MSCSQDTTTERIPTGGGYGDGRRPPIHPVKAFVTVYEEANFGGANATYTIVDAVENPGSVRVMIDVDRLRIRNDSLSSLSISGAFGCRVTLYENAGFGGRVKVCEGQGNVGYVGDDFNDRTSSIIIESLM